MLFYGCKIPQGFKILNPYNDGADKINIKKSSPHPLPI